jgi:spermidine/putrescine transport system permease protein
MLVILPNIAMFEQSFRPYLPVVDIGGPKDIYSFNNYRQDLRQPGRDLLFGIQSPSRSTSTPFLTVFYSAGDAVHADPGLSAGLLPGQDRQPAVDPDAAPALFIPMWVSEALRAFAWWIILTFNGPLNALLMGVGLIEDPIRWQNGAHLLRPSWSC